MKSSAFFTLLLVLLALIPAGVDGAPAVESLVNIPLAFTLNQGQTDPQVRFTGHVAGSSLYFTRNGITFTMTRPVQDQPGAQKAASDTPEPVQREGFAIQRTFLGANTSPEITGEDRLSWNSNYFYGNSPAGWQSDVPNYSRIRVRDLYPGIDAVCYGKEGKIKYDFIVRPGADPKVIAWKYDLGEGGCNLSVRENGDLVIRTPFGEMVEESPYCYQVIGGKKGEVHGSYKIENRGNVCTFKLEEYDATYPLVIDPVLIYGILNMSNTVADDLFVKDLLNDIALDDNDNAYVTGRIISIGTFPTTPGAFDPTLTGDSDVIVFKIDSSGNSLLYSTFIGGSNNHLPSHELEISEQGIRIAVDIKGNTYISGFASSPDFPTTEGAFNGGYRSPYTFILKLNPYGNALIYSTLIGGNNSASIGDMTIDKDGNVYITGSTGSPDFPVTPGALKTTLTSTEAFVLKLNSQGSGLVYSTLLGGSEGDGGKAIVVDEYGNAYIGGFTYSPDFPTTEEAYDRELFQVNGRGYDAFVCKLDPTGSKLLYSTFFGGNDVEHIVSLEVL
ncbi:MAG: DUF7948 domain-containing protein [Candidatus Latescibacterota bacterium]